MQVFEEIRVAWKGQEYVIAHNRVLKCIARVEGIATIGQFALMMETGALQFAKIAAAYGAILRYAGARVDDDEIYQDLLGTEGEEVRQRAAAAVQVLLKLMIPPEHLRKKEAGGKPAAAMSAGASSPSSTS